MDVVMISFRIDAGTREGRRKGGGGSEVTEIAIGSRREGSVRAGTEGECERIDPVAV
jgi:hypothetical protein